MKKLFLLVGITFLTLSTFTTSKDALATSTDKADLESSFIKSGYKTVEESLKEAEQHFEKDIQLPLRVPSITFTHTFGRFNNLKGYSGDDYEVEFLNEETPGNHFKISIKPLEYKTPISNKRVVKEFKLENGKIAFLMQVDGFYILSFEKNDWQYSLSIDKEVSNKVTPGQLVQIANSINYPLTNNNKRTS
jgi:hypothetical protein